MLKIRLWAALWAATTIILALLLFVTPSADEALPVLLAVAAACLVLIAPFDASRRPARLRVVAGCAAYALVILGSLGWAIWQGAPFAIMGLLVVFLLFGLFLTGWAWSTRHRRQRVGWGGYYDREE